MADRYDEALARAAAMIELAADKEEARRYAGTISPELANSEDELMIKALGEGIRDVVKDFGWSDFGGIPIEDVLEWIEKQGEQKPVDKIEPKFHEGEWIVDNEDGSFLQVVKVRGVTYRIDSQEGEEFDILIDVAKNNYHKFCIKDAKLGDVLRVNDLTFIFRELTDDNCQHKDAVVAYCSYVDNDDAFGVDGPDCITNLQSIHPASKEQRDTLFAKMKEAGYEWNAGKKELKKIEDEEYNGEDYGIDGLWHAMNILEKTLGKVSGYQTDDGFLSHQCAITAVKKLYGQKSIEWSEEDDIMVRDILGWLSAKSRPEYNQRRVDWLESLKPQTPWKPTASQMSQLKWIAHQNADNMIGKELMTLYQDLQKLIE